MIRAAVIAGFLLIVLAIGAVAFHLHETNSEALGLIRLGDQHYREGRYLKALEVYRQSNDLKASPHAQERIRLAQDAQKIQQAPQPSPISTATAQGTPSTPAALPASATAPASGVATPSPTASALPPTQPAAELAVGSRKTAEKVRTLLREGRFGEVQELMSQFLAEKRLTRSGDLYAYSVMRNALIDLDTWQNKADLLPHLDQWVTQSPSSSMAYTFRGAFHYGAAMQARGEGWASSVTERGRALMREHLVLTQRDLEAAYSLDATNPLPSSLMTSTARLTGADSQIMELHFRRALQYDPTFYTPYSAKLNYLMPKWGGSEAAMFAFARESLAQAPRGSALPFLLSEAHSEKGQHLAKNDKEYLGTPDVWLEIQNVHRRLMEDFPQSGNWPAEYALLARRVGRLEIAGKYHDLAFERDPEEFAVRYERGRFYEEFLGDLPRALNEYTEASRIEPSSLKALYRQGFVLYQAKQWPKAIATYSTLVKLDPENPRVYFQRASNYFMVNQYHEAMLDYSQAIALKPDYKSAYQWRAACYERLGMPDKQKEDLRTLKSLPQ